VSAKKAANIDAPMDRSEYFDDTGRYLRNVQLKKQLHPVRMNDSLNLNIVYVSSFDD